MPRILKRLNRAFLNLNARLSLEITLESSR
jgi:hypothetical protein